MWTLTWGLGGVPLTPDATLGWVFVEGSLLTSSFPNCFPRLLTLGYLMGLRTPSSHLLSPRS